MNTFPVNEIFKTIQGEARYTGTPSLFIRFQYCDIGCGWCDTKYTWELNQANEIDTPSLIAKDGDLPTYGWLAIHEIVRLAQQSGVKHIVFTGGEPFAHDLFMLTQALLKANFTVQIETSGTYAISSAPGCWITLSPKMDMNRPLIQDVIRNASEIKFPVGKKADIGKLLSILPFATKSQSIWLQPLSQSEKATEICIDAAMHYNFKVSFQVHKFIGLK